MRWSSDHHHNHNDGYAFKCPNGTRKDFQFPSNDNRHNQCVYYTDNPAQVETANHFAWRITAPDDSINNMKKEGGIAMAVFGGLLAFGTIVGLAITMAFEENGHNYWRIGTFVVFIIGFIIMMVFGILMAKDVDSYDKKKQDKAEEVQKWLALEPTKFETLDDDPSTPSTK